ncbi:MAG: hypothetical protein ABW185_07540 [Sedimenticola sp.]
MRNEVAELKTRVDEGSTESGGFGFGPGFAAARPRLPEQEILYELRKLRVDIGGIDQRVHSCERRERSAEPRDPAGTNPDTSDTAIGAQVSRQPRSFELQSAYTEVREKYSHTKLPADLLFSTAKRNVKSEDAPVYNVLCKLSKYVETGLKIASSPDSDQGRDDCLIVLTSLMRCIQDEGVQLVVNKNYDKEWSSQYRSIMSGQTDVREENIHAMNRTATILRHRITGSAPATSTRGRGRGGRWQRSSRGRFQSYHDVSAPRDRESQSTVEY